MNKSFRFFLTLVSLSFFLILGLTGSGSVAQGQTQPATHCRDPLAQAPTALFCDKYTTGYVLFKDSMSPPNQWYTSRGELEVIVFESYLVVVSKDNSHLIIPRERVVYAGSAEIK